MYQSTPWTLCPKPYLMINVTELRNGTIFEEDGQVFLVLSYEHMKQGRGSGNVKVKVRNLKTSSTVEKSFITGARVQEVFTEKKLAQYLYETGEMVVFMDSETYEQFEVPKRLIGDQFRYLKEGASVQLESLNGEILTIELPKNLEYVVSDAGAGVRGDSVSNVWKKATMENGLQVDVPLFIKDGDKVRVDTRTGQYIERVK